MKRRRPSVILVSLVTIAAALCAGCETGFVASAAQSSFTSFVNTVVTTAVNQSLNPSD